MNMSESYYKCKDCGWIDKDGMNNDECQVCGNKMDIIDNTKINLGCGCMACLDNNGLKDVYFCDKHQKDYNEGVLKYD